MKKQRRENKVLTFIKATLYKMKSASILKHLLIFYLMITFFGAIILSMGISHADGVDVKFVDALFTSASAFSDTGLVTGTTSETWSQFGQAIIAILILLGGVGIIALKVYIFNIIFKRPLSYTGSEVLSAERGSVKIGVTKDLIKVSVTLLFILVSVFSVILTIYFYNSPVDMEPGLPSGTGGTDVVDATGRLGVSPYKDFSTSLRFGIFHTISAINNAGFDIVGPNSLAPYYHHYTLQIIFMMLFITGGIGYPVIYDIYCFFRAKLRGEEYRFSLFTKISCLTYFTVATLGLGFTLWIELTRDGDSFWNSTPNGTVNYGTKGDKLFALVFNTFSTRNAGFATVDLFHFSEATLILYSIMMFIGSAPSSTAGGIRTTTLFIVVMGIWTRIRGRDGIRAFNRKISTPTVDRAYVVFTTSIILLFVFTFFGITSLAQSGGSLNTEGFVPKTVTGEDSVYTYTHIFFETASAFGTTGLSTGITSGLSSAFKLWLILLMFIGQLGVSSTILLWGNKNSKSKRYSFIEEDITIG